MNTNTVERETTKTASSSQTSEPCDMTGAEELVRWGKSFPYYSRELFRLFRLHVAPGSSVLEVGSQLGDLLASLQPSRGVGIEPRPAVAEAARQRHPDLTFVEADPASFDLGGMKRWCQRSPGLFACSHGEPARSW